MNELRTDLRNLLDELPVLAPVMPWAFVLALVYPGLNLFGSLTYLGFFESLRALLWLLYLAGLVLCLAQELDWAVDAAFALNALGHLIAMLRCFTFNDLVYTAFYALLGWFFLRDMVTGGQLRLPHLERPANFSTEGFSAPEAENTLRFCPSCGEPVDLSGRFCPFCGSPYPTEHGSAPFFSPIQEQASPAPQEAAQRPLNVPMDALSLCSSPLALGFAALFSGSVLFALLGGFHLFSLIANLPAILICVGCWLTYYYIRNGMQNTAGLTLVEVVLTTELVLCCLPLAAAFVYELYTVITGYEFEDVGPMILAVTLIALCLLFFYWNGFRSCVRSVRQSFRDGAVEWKSSIYCIVLLCIGVLSKLSSLASQSKGNPLVKAGIDAIVSVLNDIPQSKAYAGGVRDALSSLFGVGNSMASISTALSAAATVCAVALLIQMRMRNKAIRYSEQRL